MSLDELVDLILDGKAVDFRREIYDCEMVYAISYIRQVGKYRIDFRVDNALVRRSHFDISLDFIEQLGRYGIGDIATYETHN